MMNKQIKPISLKKILIILLFSPGILLSQILNESEIKETAKIINKQIEGFKSLKSPVTGIIVREVTSLGRKLIYHNDVPSEWYPTVDIKNQLIKSLIEMRYDEFYTNNKIDLSYYYYKKNKLIETVNIDWSDFDFKRSTLGKQKSKQDKADNASFYDNLGLKFSGTTNNLIKSYLNQIELNPKFAPPYLNLVAWLFEIDSKIVEEMDTLDNSTSDNIRYNELKALRKEIYEHCASLLRQLISFNKSTEAIKTLMDIYTILEDQDGYNEMSKLYYLDD